MMFCKINWGFFWSVDSDEVDKLLSRTGVPDLWSVAHYWAAAYWPQGCISGWLVCVCKPACTHRPTHASVAVSITGICGPTHRIVTVPLARAFAAPLAQASPQASRAFAAHSCEHRRYSQPHSCESSQSLASEQWVFVRVHMCVHVFTHTHRTIPSFPPFPLKVWGVLLLDVLSHLWAWSVPHLASSGADRNVTE